ncbi:MAG TPA: hypothetical protein VF987_09645, partial [Rhodospirillales bacterium]
QLGRIDEVGEHHGELTPLGFPDFTGGIRCRPKGNRRRCFQDSAPVAEGYAQLLEVRVCQVSQNVQIDTVLSEELSVFTEAVLF